MQHAQLFMPMGTTQTISTKSPGNSPKEARLIFAWEWAQQNFFRKRNRGNGKTIAICFSSCAKTVLTLCEVAQNWNPFQFGVGQNSSERSGAAIRQIKDQLGMTNPLCRTWFDGRLNCCNTTSTVICSLSTLPEWGKRRKRITPKKPWPKPLSLIGPWPQLSVMPDQDRQLSSAVIRRLAVYMRMVSHFARIVESPWSD